MILYTNVIRIQPVSNQVMSTITKQCLAEMCWQSACIYELNGNLQQPVCSQSELDGDCLGYKYPQSVSESNKVCCNYQSTIDFS